MTPNDVVKAVMKKRGFTHQSLANKLGKPTSTAVSNAISNSNRMRTDKLLEMLEAMDCEIVVRSKLKDKTEWVIKG